MNGTQKHGVQEMLMSMATQTHSTIVAGESSQPSQQRNYVISYQLTYQLPQTALIQL